jgi:3-methylcrotonyl-CoA carboxylase beta subunit
VIKNKKMLVRERMKRILDPESPFLEIGGLGGFGMPYGDLPGGGMVAGVGLVQGVYCMLSGNDATVKAGTYYPITVRKSGRVQAIAQHNKLPTIYLPDSGGAFLPLQVTTFI